MLAQAVAAISLGLLAVAGLAKLIHPEPTRRVLASVGMPPGRLVARVLGATEVLAAAVGLAAGGALLVPAVILYSGFALFVLAVILGRLEVESCGCFGVDDAPISRLHVVFNGTTALALGWAAATGEAVVPWQAPTIDLIGYAAFTGLGTYAAYLLLSVMPRTLTLVNGR